MTATLETPAATNGSVICDRRSLLSLLGTAGRCVDPRSKRPVLACVRLTTDGSDISVFSTNLDTFFRGKFSQCQVESEMDVAVDHKRLTDVLRSFSSETLNLRQKGSQLEVTGDSAVIKLPLLNVQEMPAPEDGACDEPLEVQTDVLSRLLRQSECGIERDVTSKYGIEGILLRAIRKTSRLHACATSGHILSLSTAECGKTADFSVIIPAGSLPAIHAVIEGSESVTVGVNPESTRAVFVADGCRVETSVLEKVFPPYEDVIPKQPEHTFTANAAALASAVRQTQLACDPIDPAIRVAFDKGKGITLAALLTKGSESDVRFPCKYDGAPMAIGFNPNKLLAALEACDTDEIVVEFCSPSRPIVFRETTRADKTELVFVVVPRNLN